MFKFSKYKRLNILVLFFTFLNVQFCQQLSAHPAIDLLYRFFEAEPQKSDFKKYMQTPLRQKLSSAENVSLTHNPNDGSNWSGCQVGKGVLAGTFRDISACAASACYGRDVTVDEMKNLSYADAEKVVHWLWKFIQASDIPNQSVANLTMAIQMQFGNIIIVQSALNKIGAKLRLSGRMDKKTLDAIKSYTQRDAAETFNSIRNDLIAAYGRMSSAHIYITILNKEYPKQFSLRCFYHENAELMSQLGNIYLEKFILEIRKLSNVIIRIGIV